MELDELAGQLLKGNEFADLGQEGQQGLVMGKAAQLGIDRTQNVVQGLERRTEVQQAQHELQPQHRPVFEGLQELGVKVGQEADVLENGLVELVAKLGN